MSRLDIIPNGLMRIGEYFELTTYVSGTDQSLETHLNHFTAFSTTGRFLKTRIASNYGHTLTIRPL